MALSATKSLKFSFRCSGSYAYFTSTSYHLNIYLNIWTERRRDQQLSGKIGQQLTKYEKLPIINFGAIERNEIFINQTDQRSTVPFGYCQSNPGRTMHTRSGRKRTSQSLPMTAMCNPVLSLVQFPNKPYKRNQNSCHLHYEGIFSCLVCH
ncbi:hypothetical protein AVEN_273778-1 [Araneus ventricosus]|uniref:Uncharacterized protein n=1 Tax=Araneus ventricosus TaxID=182803 RepID=A0A4Y2N5D0_ARAVE|nr:hypothetical protein AVEN_273778-1 [Araneus ventricosus]